MIITHRKLQPYLDKLLRESYLQPGYQGGYDYNAWFEQEVLLEFPCGELAKDALTTLALIGRQRPEIVRIGEHESLDANGLEGKARVRKPFILALLNMRDILPYGRGRIVIEGGLK